VWSKFLHLAVDACLVSTLLAGVKRTTGIQQIANKDIRQYVEQYLQLGEWLFDSSIVLLSATPYFERKQ
ncbi:hypothetical protein BX666DRAFT_1858030, partial [Dichotomocladium elegans]